MYPLALIVLSRIELQLAGLARSATGGMTGGVTVMVMVSLSLRFGVPSSVTSMVTLYVPGPCASVGVQVNRPVAGSMLAPAGTPAPRLNVRLSAVSRSAAVTVKRNSCPTWPVLLPIGSRTGG